MGLRWGIIGAGDIADRGMAPAINAASNAELLAVQSRDIDKARAFATRHRADRAYSDIEHLLANADVDAVYVATPNSFHAAHTIMAARAGKHVLCEKPMATTLRDAEAMIEACERDRVKLGVVYQNRYHPAHVEMRRLVLSGAVGEIDFASAQLCRGLAPNQWSGWRADPDLTGSGAIVAQAVHPVDLLRFVMDCEVDEVIAMTNESPPDRTVDEMVHSVLRFRNGAHASVVAGMLVPRYDNDILIYGRKAKLKCVATIGSFTRDGKGGMLSIEGENGKQTEAFEKVTVAEKMTRLVEDFCRAIVEESDLHISGQNGLQMVKIASALQQSARERRAVSIR